MIPFSILNSHKGSLSNGKLFFIAPQKKFYPQILVSQGYFSCLSNRRWTLRMFRRRKPNCFLTPRRIAFFDMFFFSANESIDQSPEFLSDPGLLQSPAKSSMSDGNEKRNYQVLKTYITFPV
jgi:hypothetical protein